MYFTRRSQQRDVRGEKVSCQIYTQILLLQTPRNQPSITLGHKKEQFKVLSGDFGSTCASISLQPHISSLAPTPWIIMFKRRKIVGYSKYYSGIHDCFPFLLILFLNHSGQPGYSIHIHITCQQFCNRVVPVITEWEKPTIPQTRYTSTQYNAVYKE